MFRKGALEKVLPRLLLRVRLSLIHIVEMSLGQLFVIFVFADAAKLAPRDSGKDDVSTGVETDGQPRVHRAVVIRRRVSVTGAFKMTSLKLSTVGVEFGS